MDIISVNDYAIGGVMFHRRAFHRLVKSWGIRPPIGKGAKLHHCDAEGTFNAMHVVS